MKSFLFKPIGRQTYIIGLLVIWLVGMGIGLLNFGMMSYGSFTSSGIHSFPILLIITLVYIVWDYKRIRDISLNPSYKFLLLIPLITVLLPLITGAGFGIILNGSLSWVLASFSILSLIKLLYRLFLIFKKGSIERAPIPVPTSSPIPTPSSIPTPPIA